MFVTKMIDEVRVNTSSIILFTSVVGKDGIMLLDLLSNRFNHVYCVFMYIVKDLSFINKYIEYQQKRYKNCSFTQVPHFELLRMISNGELGMKQDKNIRRLNLSTIADEMCNKLNTEWSCFGFKKSDGLSRRLQLNTYKYGGLNEKNKRLYPLANIKNKDVLAYIKANKLIPPLKYNNQQSNDIDPKHPEFLMWCKKNYPTDLEKIFKQFPLSKAILFNAEQNNE